MPDVVSVPSQDMLPLWDSFEATFFVVAGMSVGFVLGYLFPSIWRTLRRRFRPHRQFIISEISLERHLDLNLKRLEGQIKEDSTTYSIIELFVIARNFFQKKEFRSAVKIYGEILTSTRASTPHIHQAMFELAQVYFALQLYARAFDTGLELLKRKPRDSVILNFILDILDHQFDAQKFLYIFKIYKGNLNEPLKKKMSFIAAKHAEYLLSQNLTKTLTLLRVALKIDSNCSYAKILNWKALSIKIRRKKVLSIRSQWIAFSGDLISYIKILKSDNLSIHANSYLLSLFLSLYEHDRELNEFLAIQEEFLENLNISQMSEIEKKLTFKVLFQLFLNFENIDMVEKKYLYHHFFNKIFNKYKDMQYLFSTFFLFPNENISVNNMINPDIIKPGFRLHQCKNCQSIFQDFQWFCNSCGVYEPLKMYFSSLLEYAFNEQNWSPDKDNRNRCAHSYSYSEQSL